MWIWMLTWMGAESNAGHDVTRRGGSESNPDDATITTASLLLRSRRKGKTFFTFFSSFSSATTAEIEIEIFSGGIYFRAPVAHKTPPTTIPRPIPRPMPIPRRERARAI